jgi:hypothetical protein
MHTSQTQFLQYPPFRPFKSIRIGYGLGPTLNQRLYTRNGRKRKIFVVLVFG